MIEAKLYKKEKDYIICQLCNHFCRIANNQFGICNMRKNIDGKLFSLNYNKPVAINIDPIEKKPLFHFLPGSYVYSLGTLGCNLKCSNCQNWQISQAKSVENLLNDLQDTGAAQIVKNALEENCPGIAYTYNEPTIFFEYALEIMKIAKEKKLKNIWVTNGYMSDLCLDSIIPYLDAANVDLKSMDNDFYIKNCGAKLDPVLKNLKILHKNNVHLEITTLIIPKLSDNLKMLKKTAEFIAKDLSADVPWHISRFSPELSWKLKDWTSTDEKTIDKAYEIGKKAGLKYVYAGNIYNTDKENTYCPNCGFLVLQRLGYKIKRFDNDGKCSKCQENLHIIE